MSASLSSIHVRVRACCAIVAMLMLAGPATASRAATVSQQQRAATAAPQLFAPTSVWNQPLAASAPLDPASSTLSSALAGAAASEYQLGTGPWIATSTASTPIYQVPADQPTVTVQLDNPTLSWRVSLQSAFDAVPIPSGAQPAAGPDQHMVIWQPSTDEMWEFFHMRLEANGWHAGWGGAIAHVSQSPGYYTTSSWPGALPQWGATASSLAVAGGVITLAEIQSGQINHALALDVPQARAGVFAFPAQRTDGVGTVATDLPEGAHLRLDPNLNLSALHLPTLVMMMAQAAQKYGIIVRDQTQDGISFYIQDPTPTGTNPFYANGVPAKNGPFQGQWPTALMHSFPWGSIQVLKMNLQSLT
ncbi:MAG: hypothetical protein ABSG43_06155 [Solirubrobacteraceae bacterium]|jgi:hypothetical protein